LSNVHFKWQHLFSCLYRSFRYENSQEKLAGHVPTDGLPSLEQQVQETRLNPDISMNISNRSVLQLQEQMVQFDSVSLADPQVKLRDRTRVQVSEKILIENNTWIIKSFPLRNVL
jgi:hypothetical protein